MASPAGPTHLVLSETAAVDFPLLIPTVACGVAGTLAVRASAGLRRPLFVVIAVMFYIGATVGLARLVTELPVGPVYAVWAGLASVTLLSVDKFVFHESLTLRQVSAVLVIVMGVVLINLQVQG